LHVPITHELHSMRKNIMKRLPGPITLPSVTVPEVGYQSRDQLKGRPVHLSDIVCSCSHPLLTPTSSRPIVTSNVHLVCLTVKEWCRSLYKKRKMLLYNAEALSDIIQSTNLTPIYEGACNNFNMPSYMPNMMAALGTVRKRWGVSPPYMATIPSLSRSA